MSESEQTQGDYPTFPTDTNSPRYNEVSTHYANQITRLEDMKKAGAPTATITAQLRLCHGLAIGLENWLQDLEEWIATK